MKKLLVTILSLCILLIGCTHTESNSIETDFLSDELILQEQISPNKEYVTEEKDGSVMNCVYRSHQRLQRLLMEVN